MKIKHLILGKGFMGLSVYGAIKDTDKKIIWNYKPESASKSAAGILTESWYTASTIRGQYKYPFTREMVTNGIKFLTENGAILLQEDELRINEVNVGSEVKVSKDTWLLWNKDEYLDSPTETIQETILDIDFVNKKVETTNGIYEAENLYVCLGINLLDFTKEIPLRPRLGQALFIDDSDQTLRTYYTSPYTHFTLRPWGNGKVRIGDTTSKTHLPYILKRFGKGEITKGVRPAPIKDGLIYHKLKNTHIFTSGGRVGFGLSGMVGYYFQDLIDNKIQF